MSGVLYMGIRSDHHNYSRLQEMFKAAGQFAHFPEQVRTQTIPANTDEGAFLIATQQNLVPWASPTIGQWKYEVVDTITDCDLIEDTPDHRTDRCTTKPNSTQFRWIGNHGIEVIVREKYGNGKDDIEILKDGQALATDFGINTHYSCVDHARSMFTWNAWFDGFLDVAIQFSWVKFSLEAAGISANAWLDCFDSGI